MSYFVECFIDIAKELRIKKQLTLEQLADLSKIHKTTIGKIERKENLPSLAMAEKIAVALEIPLSKMIYDAEQIALKKRELK